MKLITSLAIRCDLDRIFTHSTSPKHRYAIIVPTPKERDTNTHKEIVLQAETMILNSLNQVRSIIIKSIIGTEKAIIFLGKTFVLDKIYNSLEEAIAGCRKDLDAGMALVIIPDASKFCVWVSIPEQMILQVS